MAARLYERLSAVCDAHVGAALRGLVGATPDHAAYLSLVAATWRDHCAHMLTIRNIFLYLDRSHVLPTPGLRGIWDLGLHLFRVHMARALGVETKLVAGLLALIQRERNGEDVSRDLLQALLRMLSALGAYGELFEASFLAETGAYYAAEGTRYMAQADVPHFLQHAEARLTQEAERAARYLDPGTRKPLLAEVEARLLAPHVAALLDRGLDALLDAQRTADLARLYMLLRRVHALDQLKAGLVMYVKARGAAALADRARDAELVAVLLEQRARLDAALADAFARDEVLARACRGAWEAFLNAGGGSRPAELMAKYLDLRLRGEKGVTDEEVEAVLDRVMILFRYLEGKDVFEAFYKRDLSKRLLLSKSASADLEASMVAKLKAECGAAYTSKLEGMFRDIELSRDLMANYTNHLRDHRKDPSFFTHARSRDIDVSVHVLTTGYWPAYPPADVAVPAEIQDHMARFEDFYAIKFQGRRIAWQHNLGHCVLKARFPSGRKELAVSQLQATVLMLCFGTGDALVPFAEVKARTRIEDGELRRTLQSLACGKVRVLRKEPKGREVEDGDAFAINAEFAHKQLRIRINTIQLRETVEENEKTHEAVFRDRQYQVDAAIVRIMKARKTLSHPLLMSELMAQLKFPAKPLDLKKRIESLIERDYLERDEDNPPCTLR
eukprot:TRINITY_DN13167_c0_g1_i1.p1 TRINITY_DN13167_c0_g1~~TRINITY_DN13167_c0_g1_i1.p1  ORF type:complete len:679 (+),score=298.77 TRINITY_DN13167_c0_g1_i1:25-2037(+)